MQRVQSFQIRSGETITIRPATREDAERTIPYIRHVGGESDNLTFGANEFQATIESERIRKINLLINGKFYDSYLMGLQIDPS